MAQKSISSFTGLIRKKKASYEYKIMITKGGRTTLDESYNRLKDNLLYLGMNGVKTVQVEASIPGEGKTTTVCNLGVSLSFNDKKVVIVDLDFRRPKVSAVFSVDEAVGIGDYVSGAVSSEDIIKTTEYGVDVITRGKEIRNASLVLDSEKMSNLIAELKEKYDFVLLDCPPVLLTSDYMHIARFADGILLTVAANFTKRSAVKDAVSLLQRVNVPILGTAMTMVSPDAVQYGYESDL
ncbi:MAG: CpsD/CapB family tyrosine-protein kinase [Clostridiales bacterium]|nr:CpsD/CapB family tyrosine-protein kinase [Clostridiales bacterium]